MLGSLVWSFILILVIIAISVALAFYKVYNHFPLVNIAESAFNYYRGSKLFIWQKKENIKPQTAEGAIKDAKSYASLMVPKISDSKLKDLAWSLDVLDSGKER